MNTLILDTSAVGMAVGVMSAKQHYQLHSSGRQETSLLQLIDQALSQLSLTRQDLDLIVFARGPGSFVGLRIACATAQSLAFALQIPVLGVDNLMAMAYGQSQDPHQFLVSTMQAGMQESYLAVYSPDEHGVAGLKTWQEPCLIANHHIEAWVQQHHAIWQKDFTQPITVKYLKTPADPIVYGQLAQDLYPHVSTTIVAAQPLYVRHKVAFTIVERQRGKGGNPQRESLPINIHQVQIRPLTIADIPAVYAIEQVVEEAPWSEQNFYDSVHQGYPAWVAVFAEQIVGYAVQMLAPDTAHLLIIGVSPEAQHQGVGRLLLERTQETAREHQLETQILEVRVDNAPAIRFYTQQGYQQIGIRKGYYMAGTVDGMVMSKTLCLPD